MIDANIEITQQHYAFVEHDDRGIRSALALLE